jgi:hypothetical protein
MAPDDEVEASHLSSALNPSIGFLVLAVPGKRAGWLSTLGAATTDLNGFTGTQTVEEGAGIIVRMAQLGPDGPTGGFFDSRGQRAW